jgi:neutral ceramidase
VKKFLRFFLYAVGTIIIAVILFSLASVIPIDRTPYKEHPFYAEMMNRLDSLEKNLPSASQGAFRVGYAKVNLTPPEPVSTAGYGTRRGKPYPVVHDSIYVRAVVIDNGVKRVAIVSADLLIIPPKVTEVLESKLRTIGFSLDNTYLNASHTHNSIGNWAEGITGIIYGSYEEQVVEFIADTIVRCIRDASGNLSLSALSNGTIDVPAAVRHRIDNKSGRVDSKLRVLKISRADSVKIVLISYNAHPTCLYSKDLSLSRDYPGRLVDQLEEEGYGFAMFLSGAVGSHGCNPPEYGKPCVDWMAAELSSNVRKLEPTLTPVTDSSLMMIRIPLALGEPQVKVSANWRLRPWVFRSAFGEYKPYLTALRIGDMVLLGTPCDYSGELSASVDSLGTALNFKPVITSFNGHYIGYVTNDRYYDEDHYETRLMNWYGPGNGEYITECLEKLLTAVAR